MVLMTPAAVPIRKVEAQRRVATLRATTLPSTVAAAATATAEVRPIAGWGASIDTMRTATS